ncbi:ABC transporter ATP-binding protein [Bradyrhizobium erythrophlei]|uniref:Lipopolysaccharide transport system ATP-binding protein n=1 Tax=Bradyrhizobium erythrophlei TaxID=1437360 RepID=A0A1M7SQ96_9BRAD|nr:ABC transporter ATP-binding protein [Bradyrhizobium erythrophlei]SHN60548.1 lipopolysaccharide transport system ATP-binding protein [Bradyrhizobium erythrophlei]
MSDTIISVENLSKRYLVGHLSAEREKYTALRDVAGREVRNLVRKTVNVIRGQQVVQGDDVEEIWALKDLSFDVQRGEAIGIIGNNGAGKSTLLKILSRITEPTDGRISLRGRVASLLEVGTGFHNELTGRENIFLNGAILGMTQKEIRKKFDEIVAFAEVERFLDTPVKRYSSGMYVRLAFAVAAHLEPEILVVDEVLAVGDTAFQKKCLGKLGGIGQAGRTVLFVSHNMPAIINLCQKAIVLNRGQMTFQGDAKSAVDFYISASNADTDEHSHVVDLRSNGGRRASYGPWLQKLELYDGDGRPLKGDLPIAGALQCHVEFELPQATDRFDPRLNFVDLYGQVIFAARASYEKNRDWGVRSGVQRMICEIPALPLVPGEYRIDVALVVNDTVVMDYIDSAYRLRILETDFYGTGQIASLGVFVQKHHWRM